MVQRRCAVKGSSRFQVLAAHWTRLRALRSPETRPSGRGGTSRWSVGRAPGKARSMWSAPAGGGDRSQESEVGIRMPDAGCRMPAVGRAALRRGRLGGAGAAASCLAKRMECAGLPALLVRATPRCGRWTAPALRCRRQVAAGYGLVGRSTWRESSGRWPPTAAKGTGPPGTIRTFRLRAPSAPCLRVRKPARSNTRAAAAQGRCSRACAGVRAEWRWRRRVARRVPRPRSASGPRRG